MAAIRQTQSIKEEFHIIVPAPNLSLSEMLEVARAIKHDDFLIVLDSFVDDLSGESFAVVESINSFCKKETIS